MFFHFKVNEFQAKIKDVTRKMMAVVSELSMHQATALKLQQEVTVGINDEQRNIVPPLCMIYNSFTMAFL